MKWFQHDSDALYDAKIKKLILKHGAIGYAVYFHCLELIAGTITQDNINFELEHDAEIIADDLKIQGTQDESGIDLVNKIMKSIINLGLFSCQNDHIFCYKLAYRLDNTISRSPEINNIKELSRNSNVVTTKKLLPDKNRIDKIRINKKRKKYLEYEDITEYRFNVLMRKQDYEILLEKYGKDQTEKLISKLSISKEAKGYKYNNDYMAILNWVVEACKIKENNINEEEIKQKRKQEIINANKGVNSDVIRQLLKNENLL